MEHIKQPELFVKSLTLIDLDRTVFDTDKFHDIIKAIAYDVAGIPPEQLDSVKKEKEKQKISLHTDELLRTILTEQYIADRRATDIHGPTPDETLSLIFEAVMRHCLDPEVRESLLLPGAKEYIDSLNNSGAVERNEVMFLTHGTGPLQMLKLICVGLDYMPRLIMDSAEKGKLVAQSRDELGNYRIVRSDGSVVVTRAILAIDDKAVIYIGFPTEEQGARGLLKRTRGFPIHESQLGPVPENVEETYDFPIDVALVMGSTATQNYK